MKSHTRFAVSIISIALVVTAQRVTAAIESQEGGALYVMSNKAKANSILVFQRAQNGSLTFTAEIPTKGLGTGVTNDPLMSQGAVALRADGKVLLAVNPGSGELTAFRVCPNGLEFGSKVLSGGFLPVSVTVNGNLVYVLNQLGTANISGFTVDDAARLQAIPGSMRDLAGGALALPAQVSFTPDGAELLVTEKGTQLIDIFQVLSNGTTSGPMAKVSEGKTPFGFAFGPGGSVIVSEAENRLPLKATTSSYQFTAGGGLQAVSSAVPDKNTAACWVVVTGETAWVTNTLSSTISAYHIGTHGSLTLVDSVAASTGPASSPIDMAASSDGKYLYVLRSATGDIAAFGIDGDELTPLFTVDRLPLSIQGVVAR